jgi:undecaprenyl-diphosphatase
MPDWITAIILGVVEGITEFLPISSTGHLLIAEHWVPKQSELFNVVIQCGAVIAVIPLFPQRISQFIHKWNEPATRDYLSKLILAFFITGVGGFLWEKAGHKLSEDMLKIGLALLIGGLLFVGVEFWLRGRTLGTEITWSIAVAVGLGQLVAAIFPGASRSGTTIMLSLILGLSRPAATEFSFLVGIPTMLTAGAYEIFHKLHHHTLEVAPPENWGMVALTTVIAAIVSFIAVKWLLHYVQSHTFIAFGWYRIVVGLAVLIFLSSPGAADSKSGQFHPARPVVIASAVALPFAPARP